MIYPAYGLVAFIRYLQFSVLICSFQLHSIAYTHTYMYTHIHMYTHICIYIYNFPKERKNLLSEILEGVGWEENNNKKPNSLTFPYMLSLSKKKILKITIFTPET